MKIQISVVMIYTIHSTVKYVVQNNIVITCMQDATKYKVIQFRKKCNHQVIQKWSILNGHIQQAELPKILCDVCDSEQKGEQCLFEYTQSRRTHEIVSQRPTVRNNSEKLHITHGTHTPRVSVGIRVYCFNKCHL